MIPKILTRYRTSLLIEHTSEDIVGYTLLKLLHGITKIQDNPRNIIITDFLDTLSIYLYQAELLNMDTTVVKDISVIKVGGMIETGKVLYKVPISPYPVYKTRYNEALSRILKDRKSQPQFNIQLGIEMVINLFNRHEMLEQIRDIGRQIIKDKNVVNVVFVNSEAVEKASIEALPLLRTMFPIVLKLERFGESYTVQKSVFPEIRGVREEV